MTREHPQKDGKVVAEVTVSIDGDGPTDLGNVMTIEHQPPHITFKPGEKVIATRVMSVREQGGAGIS